MAPRPSIILIKRLWEPCHPAKSPCCSSLSIRWVERMSRPSKRVPPHSPTYNPLHLYSSGLNRDGRCKVESHLLRLKLLSLSNLAMRSHISRRGRWCRIAAGLLPNICNIFSNLLKPLPFVDFRLVCRLVAIERRRRLYLLSWLP